MCKREEVRGGGINTLGGIEEGRIGRENWKREEVERRECLYIYLYTLLGRWMVDESKEVREE